jgi:serine O-acetyltransferase
VEEFSNCFRQEEPSPEEMKLSHTLRLIKSDLAAAIRFRGGTPNWRSALGALLTAPSLGLAIWRFQSFFHRKRVPVINRLLAITNLVIFALEMEPEIEAADGLVLLNPSGIMIHGHTRIGRNCVFVHQITTSLGPRVGFDPVNDYIVIGDDVVISAGVRIIGNLTIGAGTWVGPNTVVTESIPANSIAMGRQVSPRTDEHPSYDSPTNITAGGR